jgi:hypothetical protein
MFEDWKHAWREAVDNFRRELEESEADDGSPAHVRAMRRELLTARSALDRLDREIGRARKDAEAERTEEATCRRREALARKVGDEETVRLAADFASRHAERADILERKVGVFEQERALLSRDLEEMERVMAAQPGADEVLKEAPRPDVLEERAREDRDFARLDREARERAAEQRLEELKKRMR